MEQVTLQMLPFGEKLVLMDRRIGEVKSHALKLWSNGSGGPPGYLEVARLDDDERYGALMKNQEKMDEKIDSLLATHNRQAGSDDGVERRKKRQSTNVMNILTLASVIIGFVMMLIGLTSLVLSLGKRSELLIPFRQSLEYTARESPPLTAQGD